MEQQLTPAMLTIESLSLCLDKTPILSTVTLEVLPNEIVALVGESGSGKSVTAQAIMGLLPRNKTKITHGKITFEGQDLTAFGPRDWQRLRGKEIGMIFQEPQSSLNPSMRCGKQVAEMGKQHLSSLDKKTLKTRVINAFKEVQLADPDRVFKAYPHELSGGQKQRVMIAMALLCKPKLLIADEPTTALDVLVQQEIIQLIKSLQKLNGMSVLFISHDLSLVKQMANRIAVMKEGKIVEQGTTNQIFYQPQHPYTQGLLAARPSTNKRLEKLLTLDNFIQGDFKETRISAQKREAKHRKLYTQPPQLRVQNLKKTYITSNGYFEKKTKSNALEELSFSLYPGETLGLVGASGCGKSTLARTIVCLDPPSKGHIYWGNTLINPHNKAQVYKLRRQVQLIFQDPFAALHPRLTVGGVLDEVLRVHQDQTKQDRLNRIKELMNQVGLAFNFYSRYPHELSGGQRQRVVIARALAVEPKVLLCDESVAALDISVQAQVLNLLNQLKLELGLSLLFISHDFAVVKHMADRILVMHKGRIVEENEADCLYNSPQTPFTKALLAAVPTH